MKLHIRKKNRRWGLYVNKTASEPYIESEHLWMLLQRLQPARINEEEMMFGVTSPGGDYGDRY